MATEPYDELRHRRERDAGLLECRCKYPLPEHIVLFDAWMCVRCSKVLRNTQQLRMTS